MRHDGVTFDPAASACDMPGRQGRLPSLPSTRPNCPASAEAVRDACQVCQGRLRTPANLAGYVQGAGIRPASLPRQRPSVDAQRTGMRHDGETYFDVLCTLSSRHLCDRDLVRLRGQSSAGKQCVSIHNATCFSWGNIRMPVICLRRGPHYKSNCRLALRLQISKE